MVGVNPVYHPDIFGNSSKAYASSQTKKVLKQEKKGSATAAKGETDEQARLRRYYEDGILISTGKKKSSRLVTKCCRKISS